MRLIAGIGVVLAACGSQSAAVQPAIPSAAPVADANGVIIPRGAPADAALSGIVLVWLDTTFFVAPDDAAASFKLAHLPARSTSIAQALPLRVVGTHGAFVEVDYYLDSDGDASKDCGWFGLQPSPGLDKLRLFVKRSDIAPVTTAPFAKTYPDGTMVDFQPGAPVLPLADGKTLVAVNIAAVPVELPAQVVGYSYVYTGNEVGKDAGDEKVLLHPGRYRFAGTNEVSIKKRANADRADEHDGHRLVQLSDICGAITLRTKTDDFTLMEWPEGSGGSGFLSALLGDRWVIPEGTIVTTRPGALGIRATSDIPVDAPAAGAREVCVDARPGIVESDDGAPDLDLLASSRFDACVPRAALKKIEGPKIDFDDLQPAPTP